MKKIFVGVALFISCGLSAQWDTLNTMVEWKFEGIDFFDSNVGIVVGSDGTGNGMALYTMNRGNSWSAFISNTSRPYHDVTFTPSGTIYVITDSGRVVHLTAFPLNNTISATFLSEKALLCCFAVNDSVFYCAGENGVAFRTLDYGLTWDTLDVQTTDNINDIYFADAANGWIAGNDGLLKATSDSGMTWTWVTTELFAFYDYNGFAYQDSMGLNPYVVGQSGSGQFSNDGGLNWIIYSTGTTVEIQNIRFLNTLSGIMCGDDGYIYRTEDGGGSWFTDPTTETVDLFDIAFAGDTTAFICGDSGVVLRSRNDISTVQHQATPIVAARAYPNPTAGPLFVEVLLREESNVEIQLVNLTGQVIQSNYYENVNPGSQRFEVSTADCAAGLYFLRIAVDGAAVTMPVIRN